MAGDTVAVYTGAKGVANALMNEASRWRMALAQRIVPAYATHPKLAALMLAGSVARGCADRYSDIELGAFWFEPITPEEQHALVNRVSGELWLLHPYTPERDHWGEEFAVHGVKLDVRHMLVQTAEQHLGDVRDRHDPALPKQAFVAAVQEAIPWHGVPLLDR